MQVLLGFFMWKLFLHPKIGSFFIYLYKIQVNSRQFVLRKPDLQIFSRFSFAIEVQREEMRKIIMIKVILGIFGGGTFETALGGTFVSAAGGTFETVPISCRFYFTKN